MHWTHCPRNNQTIWLQTTLGFQIEHWMCSYLAWPKISTSRCHYNDFVKVDHLAFRHPVRRLSEASEQETALNQSYSNCTLQGVDVVHSGYMEAFYCTIWICQSYFLCDLMSKVEAENADKHTFCFLR